MSHKAVYVTVHQHSVSG